MSKYHARKPSKQSCNQQRNSRPYRAVEARQDACHDAIACTYAIFKRKVLPLSIDIAKASAQWMRRPLCSKRKDARADDTVIGMFRMLGVDVSSLRTNQTVTACAKNAIKTHARFSHFSSNRCRHACIPSFIFSIFVDREC